MIKLSIITVYKGSKGELKKTEDSVMREFGTSDQVEYIQKEWNEVSDPIEEREEIIEGRLSRRIIRGRDEGVFDGMMQALESAVGEWVIFLNAGDWFAEGMSSMLWAAIDEGEGLDFLYFDGMTVDCDDGRGFLRQAPDQLKLQDFYRHVPVLHPCLWVRRPLLMSLGFDRKYDLAADFDLMVKLVSDRLVSRRIPIVGAYVLSGGLSEQRRVRARLQATRSLLRHRESLWQGVQILSCLVRFFAIHFLIVGIVHRLPRLRSYLHRRRLNRVSKDDS